MRPLQEVLDDITKFMINTNEILVLDFHRFPVGFNRQSHQELISRLMDQASWSELALPKTATPDISLDEIWRTGKRLIIAYEDEAAENDNTLLWENVIHLWGNTADASSLKQYLERKYRS